MKMLIPAIALLSTTAMAADLKFNAEGRFDYINATVKHEQVTATNNFQEKTAGIQSNILRLNAVATINENLAFRFRYRFSTAQNDTKPNRDLTWNNVDFFYVDHTTPWFTARLGKHNNSEMAGREYFVAGTDYTTTMASNSTLSGSNGNNYVYAANNSAVYNLANSDLGLYRTGASLIFKQIEGQVFTLNVSEAMKTIAAQTGTNTGTDTASATNDSKNSSLAYGAYYNGTFFNKMFQPTVGYTMAKLDPESDTAAANTKSATFKLMAVGVRSEVAGFTVDLDWKQYKRPDYGLVSAAAASSLEDKTTSIWANIAYTWDNITPFVNYINDKYDMSASDTKDYKRNAISGGVQIKPFKDNNFRYHITYTSDIKKIDAATSGDKKVKSNQIAAGIKFDI